MGDWEAKQSRVQLVSMTVRIATILLRSTWAKSLKTASKMPTTARDLTKSSVSELWLSWHTELTRPQTPNFTSKPLKKIENSVEASTWALRSHDMKGHNGTFIAKPNTKKSDKVNEEDPPDPINCCGHTAVTTNRKKLPSTAQIAISTKASSDLSDLDVERSRNRAHSIMSSNDKIVCSIVLANNIRKPATSDNVAARSCGLDLEEDLSTKPQKKTSRAQDEERANNKKAGFERKQIVEDQI